jgi:hypothetical protein
MKITWAKQKFSMFLAIALLCSNISPTLLSSSDTNTNNSDTGLLSTLRELTATGARVTATGARSLGILIFFAMITRLLSKTGNYHKNKKNCLPPMLEELITLIDKKFIGKKPEEIKVTTKDENGNRITKSKEIKATGVLGNAYYYAKPIIISLILIYAIHSEDNKLFLFGDTKGRPFPGLKILENLKNLLGNFTPVEKIINV